MNIIKFVVDFYGMNLSIRVAINTRFKFHLVVDNRNVYSRVFFKCSEQFIISQYNNTLAIRRETFKTTYNLLGNFHEIKIIILF